MKENNLLGFITIVILFCSGCGKNTISNSVIDLYILDTICIDSLYPQFINYSIYPEYSNVEEKNRCLYIKDIFRLDADSIISTVRFFNDVDTFEVPIKIRCWINDKYHLEEVEEPSYLEKLESLSNRVQRKLGMSNNYQETLLLTQNDTSYLYDNRKLVIDTKNGRKIVSEDFYLNCPEYNQLLVQGDVSFFRTGTEILMSKDKLKTWNVIYKGTQGIKESMFYNKNKKILIFTQYTPGAVRNRHYVLSYNVVSAQIDTIHTFCTLSELNQGIKMDCARHIHTLSYDSFSNKLFLGTGDEDLESGVYYADPDTLIFTKLGSGSQSWRTLQFFFEKNYIFWDTDSKFPQYISSLRREAIQNDVADLETHIVRFPLFNSALWCALKQEDMYILPTNSEGQYYDNKHRLYGIKFNTNGVPEVYNLFEEVSKDNGKYVFHQLFPLGIHRDGKIWFYDTGSSLVRKFVLKKSNH